MNDYNQQIQELESRQAAIANEIDNSGRKANETTRLAINKCMELGPRAFEIQKNARIITRVIIVIIEFIFICILYGTGHPVWGTLMIIAGFTITFNAMKEQEAISIGNKAFTNKISEISKRRG